MRLTLIFTIVLALAGGSQLAAQQTGPGGIGGGGIGGGRGGNIGSSDVDGGRRHGIDGGDSGNAKRHARSDSTATPPKPGEVVKKGLLNLPEGLGGDKVHTAYLETGPR